MLRPPLSLLPAPVTAGALRLLLTEVHERPLYAHVAKHNVGSLRVLEKCDFKVCGEEAQVSVGGGPPADEWVMRLDRTEGD